MSEQTYRYHFLFLEFDENDLLKRFRLSRDHLDSCAWDGICVAAAFESEEFRWSGFFGHDQFLLDPRTVLPWQEKSLVEGLIQQASP